MELLLHLREMSRGVVDDGVSVADQWFFTTRAAAEEYYYSKVNPKDWMWFDHYPWVYSQMKSRMALFSSIGRNAHVLE